MAMPPAQTIPNQTPITQPVSQPIQPQEPLPVEPGVKIEFKPPTPSLSPATNGAKPDNKFQIIIILLLLVLITLILGFGVIFYYQMQKDSLPLIKDDGGEIEQNIKSPTPSVSQVIDAQGTFTVELPRNNDLVNGEIKVHFRYDGQIDAVKISIYDESQQILGSSDQQLDEVDQESLKQVNLDISISPGSDTGVIRLIPIYKNYELTNLATEVSVKFLTIETGDRLKLYSPILRQVISKTEPEFVIRGQMHNFFEGMMSYRLVSSAGVLLKQGNIQAMEDNYVDFVSFEEQISVEPFPSDTSDNGRLELYEVSMQDGSEKVLLSVPLRFK